MQWTTIPTGQAARASDGVPRASGIHDIETALDGAGHARFSLSLPTTIADGAPLPLVLVLHYAGQPTRFYGRPLLTGLIEPAWRSLGAIMVAPESLGGQWQDEANEAFVLGLVHTLIATYAVDTRRLVVCGYSMGAIGTWHFITHYPELFSAAVPIAGFPQGELRTSVPVHAFHASRDELFPSSHLRDAVRAARAAGSPIELSETEVNGHFDVNGHGRALAAVPAWLAQIWTP